MLYIFIYVFFNSLSNPVAVRCDGENAMVRRWTAPEMARTHWSMHIYGLFLAAAAAFIQFTAVWTISMGIFFLLPEFVCLLAEIGLCSVQCSEVVHHQRRIRLDWFNGFVRLENECDWLYM